MTALHGFLSAKPCHAIAEFSHYRQFSSRINKVGCEMDFKFDLSDPIGMIKKGLEGLAESKRTAYLNRLELLSRFEKRAAWTDEAWTYWDFEAAPAELAHLEKQNLSMRQIDQRCRDWIAKDKPTKPPLVRLIEAGNAEGMADKVRDLIEAGEDPNAASLLKETPLEFARYFGSREVFDVLIEMGAQGDKAGFSKLHHAVRYGDVAAVMPLIDSFDILWWRLDANSVLLEAVLAKKPDLLVALLDHIVAQGRMGDEHVSTCCAVAASQGDPAMLRPFLKRGVQPDDALDATLEKFDTQTLRLLLEHGVDAHQITDILMYHDEPLQVKDAQGQTAITNYIRTLLNAGWSVDDLDEFEQNQIRFVTEAYMIPPQDSTAPGYLDPASSCAGNANPEERNLPYYLEMLRTGDSSFQARQRLPDLPHGAWTADRFGQSTTRLPDGRWIQIGGEHEDSYDPDFVIFSDVVALGPNGDARIFFYPASIFPPTDFHTATLIGDAIWIIGGLGYMGDRKDGVTPVFRLNLKDFSISSIETTGDGPGWISRHAAELDGAIISVSGGKLSSGGHYQDFQGAYSLDVDTCKWTRLR
ncbi:ankyrin repeat domain-containing protein [Litoreibacter albidus]|uniref:ankyrin repeat domain-containing protein n=2 Tax=Roseobacteraceae TaxID=2854170 RepID=UPI00373505AB